MNFNLCEIRENYEFLQSWSANPNGLFHQGFSVEKHPVTANDNLLLDSIDNCLNIYI